jgi:hypothetical protein
MPMTRSAAAVAAFTASGAAVLNGYSTTASVARPTIHQKKRIGPGVLTRSRCVSALCCQVLCCRAPANGAATG